MYDRDLQSEYQRCRRGYDSVVTKPEARLWLLVPIAVLVFAGGTCGHYLLNAWHTRLSEQISKMARCRLFTVTVGAPDVSDKDGDSVGTLDPAVETAVLDAAVLDKRVHDYYAHPTGYNDSDCICEPIGVGFGPCSAQKAVDCIKLKGRVLFHPGEYCLDSALDFDGVVHFKYNEDGTTTVLYEDCGDEGR